MHVAVDLDWFVQVIGFGLLTLLVFWFLVKKTASWYFVDSNFESDYSSFDYQTRDNSTTMGLVDSCAVCGKTTTKNCAACKMVKYW